MLIVLKSGSLNLLETSGLVQACNGIALPHIQIVFLIVRDVVYNPFTSYYIEPRSEASSGIEVFHSLILASFPMIVQCVEFL